jgi:choline dehydrogenase-like flavoprotein
MALPTRFEGYFPKFSRYLQTDHDRLTWAVLKAHTHNWSGSVTLRSADPRDPPRINFRYFEEGDDRAGRDLDAVVKSIQFVRELAQPLIACGLIAEECKPGPQAQSDEALAEYVRNNAWGHHASCSCPIGPVEHGGVVDSHFRVHGTRRLRIADASIFPRIPGFFLVSAVYMIAEKAAETILHAAQHKGATHASHGWPARDSPTHASDGSTVSGRTPAQKENDNGIRCKPTNGHVASAAR